MGLTLTVGLLADIQQADPEGLEYFQGRFEAVNRALRAEGLPEHKEPLEGPGLPWSADMMGYWGLHYVRRIAAHVWAGHGLPEPGEADGADPLTEEYFSSNVGGAGEGADESKRFDHLMFHSDAEGFYLPLDFKEVLFPAEELRIPGGMIGSAPRLLDECERIARVLQLPPGLESESEEVLDAADNQGEGEGWKRYGVEVFHCLRLIEACQLSIRTGAALVFT